MQITPNHGLKKYESTDAWHLQDQTDNLDAIDAALNDSRKIVVAGGTGTAITLAVPSVTAYSNFQKFSFIASADNGGAATTIRVNALATKPLYKPNTTTAPNLTSGKAYDVWHNGTAFFLKASAEGNASAADVLAGKTFSNDADTGLVGTLQPKQVATGSASFQSTKNYLDVTGLTFLPKTLIATWNYSAAGANYYWICVYSVETGLTNFYNWQFSQGSQQNKGTGGFSNVTATGFRFTDASVTNWDGVNTQFKWLAIS